MTPLTAAGGGTSTTRHLASAALSVIDRSRDRVDVGVRIVPAPVWAILRRASQVPARAAHRWSESR